MAGPRRRGGLHLTSGIIYGRGGRSGPLERGIEGGERGCSSFQLFLSSSTSSSNKNRIIESV